MKCEIERFLSRFEFVAEWQNSIKATNIPWARHSFDQHFKQLKSFWKFSFFFLKNKKCLKNFFKAKRKQKSTHSYWSPLTNVRVVLNRRQNKVFTLFCAAEKNTHFFLKKSKLIWTSYDGILANTHFTHFTGCIQWLVSDSVGLWQWCWSIERFLWLETQRPQQ